MALKRTHYHVAPRYTPGSPACVDEGLALRVAREEARAIQYYLMGVYGPEHQTLAETVGLAGVAERRTETRKGWQVHDLCTGATFLRPFRRDR